MLPRLFANVLMMSSDVISECTMPVINVYLRQL